MTEQDVTPPVEPTEPAEPDSRVPVSVAGPLWVSAFQASDTLTVDRLGVLVDEDDVEALTNLAADSGVTLKVGS